MKKQFFALALAALTGASALYAENGMFSGYLPENWTADVVAAIKYTRNYYSSNWHEGGTNTHTALLKYDADVQGNWKYANWRNLVNLAWGEQYTKGIGTRKSEDKIFWESTVYYNMTEILKPYAGVRFESQFSKTYEYTELETGKTRKRDISCFMDPGYLTEFAGLAYVPNDIFSQSLAFANRMTFSEWYGYADDSYDEKIAAGRTDQIKQFKDEPGLESITEVKYNLSDVITFKSRLWTFVNFKGVDEIDGKWTNTLSILLTPYIEFSFGNEIYYDKDLDEDTQYKDSMYFGLTWRWF